MERNSLNLPDVQYLRDCFTYDPSTGVVTWKFRPIEHFIEERAWKIVNRRLAGKQAGYPAKWHIRISLGRYVLSAHQVAWAMVHGRWAEATIDHINGNWSDNRLSNLRLATQMQNQRNKRMQSNNRSGFKGVCWHKDKQLWMASIMADRKLHWLGYFTSPEAAHAAYCEAAARLHKEFARFS